MGVAVVLPAAANDSHPTLNYWCCLTLVPKIASLDAVGSGVVVQDKEEEEEEWLEETVQLATERWRTRMALLVPNSVSEGAVGSRVLRLLEEEEEGYDDS